MGIIWSHFSSTEEVSWYFLVSLFQVEFRRWFYTHILRRGKKHKTPVRTPPTESVSTQTRLSVAETCMNFTFDDTLTEPSSTSGTGSPASVDSDGTSSRGSLDSHVDECEEMDSSLVPSEYSDICIFENPDFTQFGQTYRHLASPHDSRQPGGVTPRPRHLSSLSPVTEEGVLCQCEDVESPITGEGFNDTYLVFEDEREREKSTDPGVCDPRTVNNFRKGTHRRRRLWGVSETPVCKSCKKYEITSSKSGESLKRCEALARHEDGGSCGSRLIFSSFSSDSGIEECLNKSANANMAEDPYPFNSKPQHRRYIHQDSNNDVSEDSFYNFRHGLSANSEEEDTSVENEIIESRDFRNRGRFSRRSSSAPTKAKRKVTFLDDVGANSLSPSLLSASPSSPFDSSATSSQSSSGRRRRWQVSPPRENWSKYPAGSGSANRDDSSSSLDPSPSSPATKKHYFAKPGEVRDLVLIAEGERFHVYESLMTSQCHALRAHLKVTGSREVILEATRAEDVFNFLCLLYLFREEVTGDILTGVLDVAQHLGCDTVTAMCQDYLLRLSLLPHLCPHHHHHHHHSRLLPYHPPRHLTNPAVVAQYCGGEGAPEDSSSGSAKESPHHNRTLAGNTQVATMIAVARTNQQRYGLCACADKRADRVVAVLQLALRYGLKEVYEVYVRLAARMASADWVTCARTREDILQSRIARLENAIINVTVTRSSLIGCNKHRHQHDRLSIQGVICLRCMSRRITREANISV
ncbi:hypothetical protein ACOMHN_004944 [Nucella lapillus]